MTHYCKHCNEEFEKRRKNHTYCSNSCKTLACYDRNKYAYVSGGYQKDPGNAKKSSESKINKKLKVLIRDQQELKGSIERNTNQYVQIISAAIGSGAADVLKYFGKKVFNPLSLSVSKNDFTALKNDNKSLEEKFKEFIGDQNKEIVVKADDYL